MSHPPGRVTLLDKKKIESSAGSLAFNQRWSDFIAIQRNLKFEIGSSLFPLFMIWLEHFYWKRQIFNLTFSLAPWSFSPPPASFEWQPPLIRIRPQTPKDVDDQPFLNVWEKKSWNQKDNSTPYELSLHWKQDNIKTRQIWMFLFLILMWPGSSPRPLVTYFRLHLRLPIPIFQLDKDLE